MATLLLLLCLCETRNWDQTSFPADVLEINNYQTGQSPNGLSWSRQVIAYRYEQGRLRHVGWLPVSHHTLELFVAGAVVCNRSVAIIATRPPGIVARSGSRVLYLSAPVVVETWTTWDVELACRQEGSRNLLGSSELPERRPDR